MPLASVLSGAFAIFAVTASLFGRELIAKAFGTLFLATSVLGFMFSYSPQPEVYDLQRLNIEADNDLLGYGFKSDDRLALREAINACMMHTTVRELNMAVSGVQALYEPAATAPFSWIFKPTGSDGECFVKSAELAKKSEAYKARYLPILNSRLQ